MNRKISTGRAGSMTLCVLLWAASGEEAGLAGYEDAVLRLVPRHGGRVLSRVRRTGDGAAADRDQAYEVQVIEMPDEAALAAYMADPDRVALADVHRRVIARTQIIRVDQVDTSSLAR